jgi:hypothetical protein
MAAFWPAERWELRSSIDGKGNVNGRGCMTGISCAGKRNLHEQDGRLRDAVNSLEDSTLRIYTA